MTRSLSIPLALALSLLTACSAPDAARGGPADLPIPASFDIAMPASPQAPEPEPTVARAEAGALAHAH